MRYPSVKFIVDPAEDYQNYLQFIRYSPARFVKMFLPPGLAAELDRCDTVRTKNHAAKHFVERAFSDNQSTIHRTVADIKTNWRAHERPYFALMEQVFNHHPWPKGKYLGYASVFNMYRRVISDKTFYFSALNPKHNLATTAHELTHFIFFDYLHRHYGLTESSVWPKRGRNYIWNISETFNLTLETWRPYQKIFKTVGRPYDAAHARMLPRMQKIWAQHQDVDKLLNKYF
ncbi:MAG: hypothetical protein V1738_06215 [Patescibacteria group bacterium]